MEFNFRQKTGPCCSVLPDSTIIQHLTLNKWSQGTVRSKTNAECEILMMDVLIQQATQCLNRLIQITSYKKPTTGLLSIIHPISSHHCHSHHHSSHRHFTALLKTLQGRQLQQEQQYSWLKRQYQHPHCQQL
ncbi:Heterogeneous nuclear ribonucleoprotein U-like protein 1 [Myotis brandtii]|uniref:Heterogeneous nuclear ribonucleoprotein U-like protein 1 n=1 Tax=Myotis brandtii TaxID=109478 RepID=S7PCL7_MYOBR|nr:Heterogeneous nuclear ribonucleoprotein U-like protein 1 [Myotis brandtii]